MDLPYEEQEALELSAQGFSHPEIAQILGITNRQVKHLLKSAQGRLRAAHEAHAVVLGIRGILAGEIPKQRRPLYPEEIEVMTLFVRGNNPKEIGKKLGVSPQRVHDRLEYILYAMGARSWTQAAYLFTKWSVR